MARPMHRMFRAGWAQFDTHEARPVMLGKSNELVRGGALPPPLGSPRPVPVDAVIGKIFIGSQRQAANAEQWTRDCHEQIRF